MDKAPFGFAQPEDSPGFLLWQTTVTWQRAIKKILDVQDLSHPQFVLMALTLWFQKQGQIPTQTQLASVSKLDKMTISSALKGLSQRDLLTRQEHPTDTRAKIVRLTKSGISLVADLIPRVEATDADFFQPLAQGQQAVLMGFLQKLGT